MAGGNTKNSSRLIESYIQNVSLQAFFCIEDNKYQVKKKVVSLLENLGQEGLSKVLETVADYINENSKELPGEIEGENQDAKIAKAVMPAVNAVLSFLQSWYVYGKSLINSAAQSLGTKSSLSFTEPETMELVKQALINETFTLQQVACLMNVNDNNLQFSDSIVPEVQDMLETVRKTLEKELLARVIENKTSLQSELNNLQTGEDKFYNEFFAKECFTKHPQLKEYCIKAIEFLMELAIKITSLVKDIANYAYSFYKEEELLKKSAAEKISDLNSTRKDNPVEWGYLQSAVQCKPEIS